MDRKMTLSQADKQIHALLVASVASNREAAFQIEKGLLDAFLISGEYSKKFDESVQKFIDSDFYAEIPTHRKLPGNPHRHLNSRRLNKQKFSFVPN